MRKDYVVIDLETTGLNPKMDKIIEIGALKVINGEVVDTFACFVNPKRKLEQRIIDLTQINQQEVDEAKTIEDILPHLLSFLEELPLCGHRILFDYSFLKKACVNQNLSFERTGIDTLRISRICHPELEKKTLSAMCEHYQIPLQAHRAIHDAYATYELYCKLQEAFGKREDAEKIFSEENLIYKVKKEVKANPRQLQSLQELIERVGISIEIELDSLTKNEASRMYDKIVSEYGRV